MKKDKKNRKMEKTVKNGEHKSEIINKKENA